MNNRKFNHFVSNLQGFMLQKLYWGKFPIYNQIEEYYEWRYSEFPIAAQSDKEYLTILADESGKRDVAEITPYEIARIRDSIFQTSTSYRALHFERSVKNFMRYCKRRGYLNDW